MKRVSEFDSRTKEELVEEIKRKAAAYTPEWRFNEELPDVGASLALIYADMMADTIQHFNQIEKKNCMEFFKKIGTRLKSSVPAEGYITFQLINQEVKGCEVPTKTRLIGEAENGENTTFETIEDVYVTPSSLRDIYLSVPTEDKISLLYEKTEETPFPGGFFVFDQKKENLQKHCFSFCHKSVFHIHGAAWITIDFQESRSGSQKDPLPIETFLKQEKIRFSYYSEKGYQNFEKQKVKDGYLMLYKGKDQPPFALLEIKEKEFSSYFIRAEVFDGRGFGTYKIDTLAIRSKGEAVPELIYSQGTEQIVREFLPFGERPIPYEECYIASKEVLGKKGAFIHMDFDMDFISVPLESGGEEGAAIDWKMIMKRSAIKVDKEYDISVGEVVWEYYNGEGFKRLFLNKQYTDLFSIKEGVKRRCISVNFICPADIEPFLVNSKITYCIRIRVLKMNNFYKMKGNYIAPRVSFLKLRYEYNRNDIIPDCLILENNLEQEIYGKEQLKDKRGISFVNCREERQMVMYAGFDLPLEKGPLRILFSMGETMTEKLPNLGYEYYSNGHWRNLNIVDETKHLKKTGLLTLMEQENFTKKRLFGKERYWIRILDYEKLYQKEANRGNLPYIEGIYLNSTSIKGIETVENEYFYVRPNQENLVCHLNHQQIYQLEVWANEKKRLNGRELSELKKQGRVREVLNESGTVQEIWVLWEEVEQFHIDGTLERRYVLDRIKGTVSFPDGRNGLIPPDGTEATIQIQYSITEAEKGNLSEGKITMLESDIGFISEVSNYEATTGGLKQETIDEAIKRRAASLRHRDRAVTAKDYEDLAKEATRNIIRAKCFSNYNAEGKKQYGAVTLVLLQRDFEKGRKYFDGIREQVMNYLKPRMNSELYEKNIFQIIEPKFIELNVTVSMEVSEYSQVFDVRREAEKRLKEFLNPANFEIGVLPSEMQILNLLQEITGVRTVKNIRLSAHQLNRNKVIDIDLNRTEKIHYMLATSGVHQILIQVEN